MSCNLQKYTKFVDLESLEQKATDFFEANGNSNTNTTNVLSKYGSQVCMRLDLWDALSAKEKAAVYTSYFSVPDIDAETYEQRYKQKRGKSLAELTESYPDLLTKETELKGFACKDSCCAGGRCQLSNVFDKEEHCIAVILALQHLVAAGKSHEKNPNDNIHWFKHWDTCLSHRV
ncbi:hypothetical protein RFI_34080, partial [Reticulomyxa filosa]